MWEQDQMASKQSKELKKKGVKNRVLMGEKMDLEKRLGLFHLTLHFQKPKVLALTLAASEAGSTKNISPVSVITGATPIENSVV
jgi:hypothetical protein